MEREKVDRVYSDLRELSCGSLNTDKADIYKIARYLMVSDDYEDLLSFEEFYGSRFLSPIFRKIANVWSFSRIVDLGCGKGWLGSDLDLALTPIDGCLYVDKRPWFDSVRIFDLEKEDLGLFFKDVIDSRDLIVASELFHCLNVETQRAIIEHLKDHMFVIAEYGSRIPEFTRTYDTQSSLKGCTPGTVTLMKKFFRRSVPTCEQWFFGPWTLFFNR